MPDDQELEDMDPIMKAWMFHNWIEDYNDEYKLLENQGYLIGSFINPEMVKQLLGKDTHKFSASDEEFEALSKKILETNRQALDQKTNKRKRKRKIKE